MDFHSTGRFRINFTRGSLMPLNNSRRSLLLSSWLPPNHEWRVSSLGTQGVNRAIPSEQACPDNHVLQIGPRLKTQLLNDLLRLQVEYVAIGVFWRRDQARVVPEDVHTCHWHRRSFKFKPVFHSFEILRHAVDSHNCVIAASCQDCVVGWKHYVVDKGVRFRKVRLHLYQLDQLPCFRFYFEKCDIFRQADRDQVQPLAIKHNQLQPPCHIVLSILTSLAHCM